MEEVFMEHQLSLEKSLKRTEEDVEATLKSANVVVSLLKKLHYSARNGELREMRRGFTLIEEAVNALRQQFINAREGWDLDEESYLSSGSFVKEVLEAADEVGLSIFEQDDRLFCYPVLLKVLSQERAVLVDKVRDRKIRPSVLIDGLKKLQAKPVRFKAEVFLEALFEAYSKVVATRQDGKTISGQVIPLTEIYDLFTLLPGQTRDYTKQEFARDVYLLDQSGLSKTKGEYSVYFPASTATKSSSKTIAIVTRQGEEKKYYGISFRLE
jgi:hypothetical protein